MGKKERVIKVTIDTEWFFLALFFCFLLCKLAGITEIAHWSWWWVTAPLWIVPVSILVFGGLFMLGTLIFCAIVSLYYILTDK